MFCRINNVKSLLSKNPILLRRFSSLRLSNGESFEFPFDFAGHGRAADSAHSQLYESALELIYEVDAKEGFKFAYKSTLDALVHKDLEFFEDICEPRLLKQIKKGFNSLEQRGLTLHESKFDRADSINLTFDGFTMIYGVKHIRDQNPKESDVMKRAMNFNGVNMQVFQPKTLDPMFLAKVYPFLQIGCIFQSPMNILVKNKEGEVVAGSGSSGYHKIIFESVNESQGSDGMSHIQNLAQSMSGMFGAVGLFTNKDAMKNFMQRLFTTKDLSWKIVDIDNHLNGNPLTN